MFTPQDVEKLAALSRIALTDTERERFSAELESILGYVSEIQKLSARAPEREASVGPVRNVLRLDAQAHEPGVYTKDLLQAAPKREGDHVRVKRILNQA